MDTDKLSGNIWVPSGDRLKELEYWKKKLYGEWSMGTIPCDYTRSGKEQHEYASVNYSFNKDLIRKMHSITKGSDQGMFIVLLSGVCFLLHKYSNCDDLVLGMPVSRQQVEEQNERSLLAARSQLDYEQTYTQYLAGIRETVAEAEKNRGMPFDILAEHLNIPEEGTGNSQLKTVVMLNSIHESGCIKGIQLPLKIIFSDEMSSIGVVVEYDTGLYNTETIQEFVFRLERLYMTILKNPDTNVSEITLLYEEEKNRILYEFNKTKTNYPRYSTICELFEKQAVKMPNKSAVVYEEKKLTYAELNRRANQLAYLLIAKGVKKDSAVAIMTEKSIEMLVGILGILKAGGAYLPIDPEYPESRKKYILEDCGVSIILVHNNTAARVAGPAEALNIECISEYPGNNENIPLAYNAKNLAYIMYTSGSAGKPKGVAIEHRSVIRLVKKTNYIEFKEEDRILQTGEIVFDAVTFEIWGALLNGLTLYVTKEENILEAGRLERELEKNKITVMWMTSTLFNQLVQQNPSIFLGLRYLIVGGDKLSPYYINKVRDTCKRLTLVNGYGPTENTTFSVCCQIDRRYERDIPIGKPISNSYAYIVDSKNNLQPVGIYGELCVGGDGLARGYVNRSKLTSEKFIRNPYRRGERMYRTGDIARWLSDGKIEFLGRMDSQVKVRGYRIELEEVEAQLDKYKKIRESIVTVKTGKDGEKHLCAYYAGEGEITVQELREHLLEDLPEYMIPSYFIRIEKIPLNCNGKPDRRLLPELYGSIQAGVEYAAPENEDEKKLTAIWQKVLHMEKVGVNDEFLLIGGDSLKALKIAYEARTQNIGVTVKDIFKHRTIAQLIKNRKEKQDGTAIVCSTESTAGKAGIIRIEDRWPVLKTYMKDTDNAKELKIEIQKDITVCMHRCLPLCIILAYDRLRPWLYERYINLFSAFDREGALYVEYHEFREPYRELINEMSLGARLMEKETDIISFITDKINSGYYMNIAVDEYYLPHKAKYRKNHFIHFVLIYGYDNNECKVKTVGYGEGEALNAMEFDYDTFVEAYEKGRAYYAESAPWTSREAVQLFSINAFSGVYPFSPQKVIKKLGDYLDSTGDEAVAYYWALDPGRAAYGFKVYDRVLECLEEFFEGKFNISYNSIHLLAEHKRAVFERIKYIVKVYKIDGRLKELIGEFANVVELFNNIRLKAFELDYSIKNNAAEQAANGIAEILTELMEQLRSAREIEKVILTEAYELLCERFGI